MKESENNKQEKRFLVTDDKTNATQFTPEGLKVAIEYYNQKYHTNPNIADRGEIHGVLAIRPKEQLKEVDQKAEIAKNNVIDKKIALEETPNVAAAFGKMNDSVVDECTKEGSVLSGLKEQGGGPHKIILSVTNGPDKLAHSVPVVMTEGKFILMRRDDNRNIQGILPKIAEKLGLDYIQNAEANYSQENPKPSAPQGDSSSCHFFALGVLKDLTKKDLVTVAALENGDAHPEKSLKYSQSSAYINDVLDANNKGESIKDGKEVPVREYAQQHKKKLEDGTFQTRITDKIQSFHKDLSGVSSSSGEVLDIKAVAKEILNRRELRREKKRGGEQEKVVGPQFTNGNKEKSSTQEPGHKGGVADSVADAFKKSGFKLSDVRLGDVKLEEVGGPGNDSKSPRSFVEAMQAGKHGNIGSKGGAHGL